MPARFWKHPPQSAQAAIEACLNHARDKHRRTLEQVAADMGLANHWSLYKWVDSGRMPAVMIRPFEIACRCDYLTRYLAHAAHRLLIDIPCGRLPCAHDLQAVQAATTDAMGALIGFATGKISSDDVLVAVTAAMEELAWHRENAAKTAQPELELEDGHH